MNSMRFLPERTAAALSVRGARGRFAVVPPAWAGRLRFVCVPAAIYYKVADVASPEQALCDFSWLMLREGLQSQSQVTFHNLRRLKPKKLQRLLERYPEAVRQEVAMIVRQEKRI
jgi:hypothetical protein